MAWRNSRAIDAQIAETKAAFPNTHTLYFTIGDTAHAARKSDHNPDENGIVHAVDTTQNQSNADKTVPQAVVDALIRVKDPRTKYIIWNKRIMAGNAGPSPWVWRPYHGVNTHEHHCHHSVFGDDGSPWNLFKVTPPTPEFEDDEMLSPEALEQVRGIVRDEIKDAGTEGHANESGTSKRTRSLVRHLIDGDGGQKKDSWPNRVITALQRIEAK